MWRADLGDFVDRQVVEARLLRDRLELPSAPGIDDVGVGDTSGSGSDAMSLAKPHHDRTYGHGVLDLVPEVHSTRQR